MIERLREWLSSFEHCKIKAHWKIYKFDNKHIQGDLLFSPWHHRPDFYTDNIKEFTKNVLLYQGAEIHIDMLTGLAAHSDYDNTNAIIQIGDSSTAAAASQTALLGTSFNLSMDAGYPQKAGSNNEKVIFRATAADGIGEQAWNEFGVSNGVALHLLNRKVSASGTKLAGQTWIAEVTYTYS